MRVFHRAVHLRSLLVVTLALLPGFASSRLANADDRNAQGERGMVVSVSSEASDIGRDILKQGGNAVDAAVATAFALAVTYPQAGNIGGGGFMMIHPADGKKPVCIDYRETAPRAATLKMFGPDDSRLGAKTVGVPGTVAGLGLAHKRYGKLPWKKLVEPAIKLADEGFILNRTVANSLNGYLKKSKLFPEFRRQFGKNNATEPWQPGDRLVQKQLAGTLQKIADGGSGAFYHGKIAEQIEAEMKRGGGLITGRDLAAYQAKIRTPIHTTFRGFDVYGPPPPSSGGICLAQMLNVLEPFKLRDQGRYSPETLHMMVEAMRRAYCDRAKYLGDSDFVKIPPRLTTKQYAKKQAANIKPNVATPSAKLAPDVSLAPEHPSTTHFSVVDKNHMAVSNTFTLEQSYGSRVVVRGAGFLLNNEMGDFNWRPGYTNRKGTIGTLPNQIAPGKRMLSSQTPVIVARDGKPFLVTGSPGGRTIINTVLCVVLNVLEFKMKLRAAVDAPRINHIWFPDVVSLEPDGVRQNGKTVSQMQRFGHTFSKPTRSQGDAHSILIRGKTIVGAADWRIGAGKASGY